MEEDSGVKAPVTRLRRRLSVEQSDDVNSPGPATPTKKRGGRLAAKPQLELIDEHGADITPSKRTTRKTSVKEVVEVAEEKIPTPSRRSTRSKSNTSIVSETTQSYDSPRAKRAARRTSQVGSDSESSATPVRQTRRTRKDSASSVEKLDITLSGKPHMIEVIIEEDNVSVKSDDTTKGDGNALPTRRSPRFRAKRQDSDRKSVDKASNEGENSVEDQVNVLKQSSKNDRKSLEQKSNKDYIENDDTEDQLNVSNQTRKKNRKSLEQSNNEYNIIKDDITVDYLKETQKKDRKSLEPTKNEGTVTNDHVSEDQLNDSKQSRKKDRKSLEQTKNEDNITNEDTSEDQLNISKQTRRKSKKSLEPTNNEDHFTSDDTPEDQLNVSTRTREKDRKSLDPTNTEDNVFKSLEQTNNDVTSEDELNVSNKNNEERNSIAKSDNDLEITDDKANTTNVSTENQLKGRKSGDKLDYIDEVLNDSNQLKHKERKSIEISSNEIEIMNNSSTELKSEIKEATNIVENEHLKDNFSDSTHLMIKELDKKPKRKSSIVNKSTSALENPKSVQNKRLRTKSWTVTSLPQETDGVFYSDNETTKKNIKKRTSKEFKPLSNPTGAGDNEKNDILNLTDEKSASLHASLKSRISKEYASPKKLENSEEKPITETISPQGNKENIFVSSTGKPDESTAKFFEKAPTAILQSTVYFEDSDADSKGKGTVVMQMESEDQCVPVIDNQLVDKGVKTDKNNSMLNQKNYNDNSCEPMDIDETIPNNVSLVEFSGEKLNKSTVPSSSLIDNSLNKSSNKSKRKSSLSNTQNLEKSATENKSTLILSQLKDVSSTEHNVSKSPKITNELLSKSVGSADNVKDKTLDKKNMSQDYSTSTPLQQKRFKKLGMQINSSIIDSSNIEKQTGKQNKSNNKNEMSKISKQSESSSEDDSDLEDEEDSSKSKSDFLDDEADVASDDYESGDSRDDEEREYEDENEIVEKGETLDSDDDVSNDTDYEKDSFVVSSDEEDNELLSGSGDDLSMSDNELSMSKKSKMKYDERKKKEQKKASKEMYEARHKLNNTDNNSKSKKKKRQQIDSSDDSEEEVVGKVKKNKHLRLDSTHEDDIDKSKTNDSMIKKKSKAKRLSESNCDESLTQEQEISAICNKSTTEINDPLSVQVKLEPKTPMKDLNISTIHISENIEEVQVESNVSIMKTNEEADPLQSTISGEEDSSMSENSEIMNNYDSVLNELNNANKTKTVKSLDMSLNLNKKAKNVQEPIIDQLNLTKTKKQKIAPGSDVVDSGKSKKSLNTTKADGESSSDSIDLQLLFSEDSNNYDDIKQNNTSKQSLKDTEEDEFIPLKRTPGKINILSGEDNTYDTVNQIVLNESTKKKNKKRKSQGPTEELADDQENNNDIQIIIDTQGTYANSFNPGNISLTSSSKKKKNRNSVTFQDNENTTLNVSTANDDDAPEEVPYESTKKKNNRKSSDNHDIEVLQSKDITEDIVNMSSSLNSAKKKKKRVSENQSEQGETQTPQLNPNVSFGSPKKQKNLNVSQITPEENVHESSLNVSIKSEKKKKKRLSETIVAEDTETKVIPLNTSIGSAKNNKSKTEEKSALPQNESTVVNEKVDKNSSLGSAKKQKTPKDTQIIETQLDNPSNKLEDNLNHSKKRKRKSSTNGVTVHEEDVSDIPNTSNKLNESLESGSQKKKRKISQNEDNNTPPHDTVIPKKKNKKRKEREDDVGHSASKIFKENSFDKITITRLPASILNELDDQPRREVLELKKSSLISTTPFIVEDTTKRRNKPSKFLEESVYLNDTNVEKKQKGNIKKPKVLPFIPTAVTSGSGFTTNFQINIIPQEVQFVAQTKNVGNFKNEYLYGTKIKRLGTYETYKKHRKAKMSKF